MNIATTLCDLAKKSPNQTALCYKNKSLTLKQLDTKSHQLAQGFIDLGIKKGDRILLLIKPGFEFIIATYALMKIGAICVLIDPGIEKKHLKKCIAKVAPDGFIGIPKAHLLRLLWPGVFKQTKFFIFSGPSWFFNAKTLSQLGDVPRDVPRDGPRDGPWDGPQGVSGEDGCAAAIIFTTGSTGPPKGVVYEHGMFAKQISLLQGHYRIQPGEVDMPTFPLFALFSIAMGLQCVIPDMNPTKPAQADPVKIVQTILKHNVTMSFGSPALWKNVTAYCIKNNIHLPSIKRILIAGAPVPIKLLESFKQILSAGALVHTPYGATEALPITSLHHLEVEKGMGICVGKPLDSLEVKIIKITNRSIKQWDSSLILSQGAIGEICVKGQNVTKSYFNEPDKTDQAKIYEPDGTAWHRMGDIGYFDQQGRLWFCGRKSHSIKTSTETFFSIPCEAILNTHKKVNRTALILFQKKPAFAVELKNRALLKDKQLLQTIKDELLALSRTSVLTQNIQTVFFHPSFPVDIRHNAKIKREQLSDWAERNFS